MIKNGKNDFDIWQDAIDRMDLSEAVAPLVRGRVLLDESEVEMYNKIQKLLNSTGMESCHRFLYSLDPSELTESECAKVNNLWNLGVQRGFVEDSDDEEQKTDECDIAAEPVVPDSPAPLPAAAPAIPLNQTAFTVIYSAMRDGNIKSGEAYSNCVNTRSAKADVISKLERAGYSNISILAIEAGDPDAAGCDNTFCKQPEIAADPVLTDVPADVPEIPDYSLEDEEQKADEADDSDPMSHALDPVGVKASSATLKANDVAAMSEVTDDEVAEDDMLDGRKHNAHIDEEDDKEAADDKDSKDNDEEKASAEDEAKKTEEDAEEPDEKLKGEEPEDDDDGSKSDADKDEGSKDKELSAEEKTQLKDSYKKAFKAAMQKCKFETSFSELNLEQKVEFFTALSKAWGDKEDPSKFMSDKEIDQLEKIIVKKN